MRILFITSKEYRYLRSILRDHASQYGTAHPMLDAWLKKLK